MYTYYFTAGPVTWLYMSETMSDKGLSIAVCINWVFTLLVALGLPFIADSLKYNKHQYGYIWILCAIFSFSCIFFTKRKMIETKGMSKKQIKEKFQIKYEDNKIYELN